MLCLLRIVAYILQGDGSVSTGEKSEGKKTPKESVMEKRNHSDNLSFIDDPPEIVCKNTPQGIASAEDTTEFLEGTSETNSSFRKRAELNDSMDKENMRNDIVNRACDETGDTIDQRCLPPPASRSDQGLVFCRLPFVHLYTHDGVR